MALSRCKEFLTSNLLYSMYSDAISGSGSSNANFPLLMIEEPNKETVNNIFSSLLTSIHISRQDAFIKIQHALGNAVCKWVDLAS